MRLLNDAKLKGVQPFRAAVAFVGVHVLACFWAVASAAASPLAPDEAIGSFQWDGGLEVELVAAEPLTGSPCALAWDSAGRMFVVENRGYPTGMPDGSAGGAVVTLEDLDGDGRMDRRTVFAEGLTFPNGLLPWQGGFYVTCAPDVYYLKDTTGDGKADVQRTVLSGFGASRSTQLRVAHPTLGWDGWIYLTSGLSGAGSVFSPLHPERTAIRVSSDARFHPSTHVFETIDGRGQFGQAFDDWGNRFHCMNRVHIQHVVLPSRFLNRNPDLAFSQTIQNVPEEMVDDLLQSKNLAARIYPISDNLTTADSHAGTFSAACGIHVYRGDGLPVEYYGDVFACDPTGNLVHRDALYPKGPTFASRMVNEGREFFASRDNWFRPVFLATGPDGALYICDMYRKTIEHPDYLPEEVRKRTDFDSGRHHGRIWRIRKEGLLTNQADGNSTVSVGNKSQREVENLGHANGWQRAAAMRSILESGEDGMIERLQDLLPAIQSDVTGSFAQAERAAHFRSRDLNSIKTVNALNTLMSLTNLDGKDWASNALQHKDLMNRLLACSVDPSPGIRLAAWRWLSRLPPPGPEVEDAIVRVWSEDPNPLTRFWIALTLGNWRGGAVLPALADMAYLDGGDHWFRAALLSGLRDRSEELMNLLVNDSERRPPPLELIFEIGRCLGRKERKSVLAATGSGTAEHRYMEGERNDTALRVVFHAGFLEGVDDRLRFPTEKHPLTALGYPEESVRRLIQNGIAWIGDPRRSEIEKRSAIRLAALSEEPQIQESLFARSNDPSLPMSVQNEILMALAIAGPPQTIERLIAKPFLDRIESGTRRRLLETLLSDAAATRLLLERIDSGRLNENWISIRQRDRLKNHAEPSIRALANSLFASTKWERSELFERFGPAARMPGDSARGRALFAESCASCHRLEGEGYSVGPDLFGIRNQSKETILLHVLAPNYEITPGFEAYEVETRDGEWIGGMLAESNDASLLMRQALGVERNLLRENLKSIRASERSLMPEGFEQSMSLQDFADLLAFLKGE